MSETATVRSVTVRLNAEIAKYVADVRTAGRETDKAFAGVNTRLSTTDQKLGDVATGFDRVETAQRKVTNSTSRVDTTTSKLNRTLDGSGKSIDRYSGRLGLLGDALITLGPAAVTTAAVAVPAVAAIGSEVGFLATGVGVGVFAFHGLGDALTKFNKASAQPTAANLAAAHLAMEKLPPDAQRLVLQLHRLGPELKGLQQAAGSGLFPGVSAGLRSVMQDAPLAKRGLHGISLELGGLARDTGKALSSDEWRPFLRFLGREAPASIDATSRSAGHAAHGVAELWMALSPLNRDFDAGLLRVAKDFDRWASSAGRTKGFQDFLAYVRENGPRVVDLLGQASKTLIDIGTAAAPIGGPVLTSLTDLLKVVDAIAQSDFGTPLLGGLLAFRLYARVAQLAGVQVQTSFKGMAAAPGQVQTQVTKLATTTRTATTSMIADFRAMSTEFARDSRAISTQARPLFSSNPLGMASTLRATEKTTKGVGRFKSTVLSAFSGTSAAAERTRSRLAGVAKGGAAIGATAVVLSGYADKAGLSETATLGLTGAMIGGAPGAIAGGAVGALLDMKHASDQAGAGQRDLDRAVGDSTSTLTTYVTIAKQAADERDRLAGQGSNPLAHPGLALGNLFSNVTGKGSVFDQSRNGANEALTSLDSVKTAFGSIFEGLNGPGVGSAGQSLVLTTGQLQAVANRAQPAMLALGITTNELADAAARGDGSLDHLTGRIVAWTNRADTARGRTDAVAQAFAGMADETLTTDQRVQALSDSLDALLGPGLNLSQASDAFQKGLNDLTGSLAKNSRTLRGNSDAAIQNRQAIRDQVSNISALIKAQAAAGASPKKLTSNLKQQRQALIDAGAAAGVSRADMKAYLDQLGLTPKLVKTSIELAGTAAAEANLQHLTRARVIHITVKTDHLGAIDTTGTGGHVLTGNADGGTIGGKRHPYGDKILMLGAPGEEVISNRHGQADRYRADRAHGRIPRYGFGGTVGTVFTANPSSSSTHTGNRADDPAVRAFHHEMTGVRSHLHSLSISLAAATKTLNAERQARQNLVQNEQQLAASVRDQFRSDIFGTDSVWGASSNPDDIVRGDIRGARQFRHLLERVQGRGGSPAVLAQIGTLEEAQQAAGLSRHDLRQLSHDVAVRRRLTQNVGQFAGMAVFGDRIAEQTRVVEHQLAEVRHLRREVHQSNQELAAIRKHAASNAKDTASALDKGAAKAARKVPR